jgi:uncharacterized protein (DUF2267 family)
VQVTFGIGRTAEVKDGAERAVRGTMAPIHVSDRSAAEGRAERSPSSAAAFLEAIAGELGLSESQARDAAIHTVAALADRLTPGQAHVLVASLPSDLRALFETVGREREGRRIDHARLVELVDRVAGELAIAPASAELLIAAVFRALERFLPREVAEHVGDQLPADLRAAWRAPEPDASTSEIASDLDLTRQLVADVERSGSLPVRVTAREAFASVLCIFAQRLSGGETRELLLGLPRALRPLVERCMLERREEPTRFGVDELVAGVAQDLGTDLEVAERIVAAVFAAVTRVLPREELEHVASQLPEDLRTLWLA